MNGYCISLPAGLIGVIVSAVLSYKYKSVRNILKHVIAIIYASINVFYVYRDSYLGIVQQFRSGLGKYDDLVWADIVAMVAISFFGMLLYAIGVAFSHLGFHLAMWRKFGVPKGEGFWEFMDRLSLFKERRKLERESGTYTLFEGEQIRSNE